MGEHEFFFHVHILDNHQFPADRKEWERHMLSRIRQAAHGIGITCEVSSLKVTFADEDAGKDAKTDTPF